MKTTLSNLWNGWLKQVFATLLIISAFRSAVADWNDVPTGSMKPSIVEGDRIFINKLAYDLKVPFTSWRLLEWRNPRRGDIVVLFSPYDNRRLVKRVVGLPGDEVEMIDDGIFVNGKPAQYSPLDPSITGALASSQHSFYLFFQESIDGEKHPVMITPNKEAIRSFPTIVVPAGNYFVMGDNRNDSFDSRFFGFVERNRIAGRASAVVMSLDPDRLYSPRWSRFFKALP
jgi:signal peptidase I